MIALKSSFSHISRRNITLLSVFALFGLLFPGCKRASLNYPDVPGIEFVSYEQVKSSIGKDTLVIINLKYVDGDGDLGLQEDATAPPFDFPSKYFYNLFVPFYQFDGTNFSQILLNTMPINPSDSFLHFNQRLPYMTPEGKTKGIDGTIRITITTWVMGALPGVIPPSQGKFEITLYDRALNSSNTISLPLMNFEW